MMPVVLPNANDVLSKRTRKLLAKRHSRAAALPQKKIDSDWKGFRKTKSGNEVARQMSKCFHGKCACGVGEDRSSR
jgi:hypothetical protein